MSERQYPLHPAIAFVTGGSIASLSPQDGKPQHALSMIIGGIYAFFYEESPQGIDFSSKPTGEPACVILSIFIKGDEPDKAGIECLPLSNRRRCMVLCARINEPENPTIIDPQLVHNGIQHFS